LWAPDVELLAALARKLLDDRQVSVSEAVIARIVHSLERSPNAIRQFIARADARALGEGRPINLALVRDLMAEEYDGLS
jgi:chromosomal replication initiation ATPase DnaA